MIYKFNCAIDEKQVIEFSHGKMSNRLLIDTDYDGAPVSVQLEIEEVESLIQALEEIKSLMAANG